MLIWERIQWSSDMRPVIERLSWGGVTRFKAPPEEGSWRKPQTSIYFWKVQRELFLASITFDRLAPLSSEPHVLEVNASQNAVTKLRKTVEVYAFLAVLRHLRGCIVTQRFSSDKLNRNEVGKPSNICADSAKSLCDDLTLKCIPIMKIHVSFRPNWIRFD